MAPVKILYGKVYERKDFGQMIRIETSHTRVASAGGEWFLLDSSFRVIGIFPDREKALEAYRTKRYLSAFEMLQNVMKFNAGRCHEPGSDDCPTCRQIFNEWYSAVYRKKRPA
jgi:hypothetical protein